jgi:hypothetical protein
MTKKLTVELTFPAHTSRARVMEVLADAIYRADVAECDPIEDGERYDWERLRDGVAIRYALSDTGTENDPFSNDLDDDEELVGDTD